MIATVLVAIIGWIDYITGDFSLAVFYFLPICLAAWHAGRTAGWGIALFSALVWLIGDLAVRPHFRHPFMPYWNAAMIAAVNGVVVQLLCAWQRLHAELETRIEQRTAALATANLELRAMEREILGVAERERRRIGQDLHDSLGQRLTAASLAVNGLALAMEAANPVLVPQAENLGRQLREAIAEARTLSHGLSPVALQNDGLMHALHALADTTTRSGGVRCVFECPAPVLVPDAELAGQLYRIAQEAVNNALKHAAPGEIRIGLERSDGRLSIEVDDDGPGFPEPLPAGDGIGLRVMKHRAQMIGGTLEIGPHPAGGTRVTCLVSPPL
ncbi:MAG: sensor histidine kinase [Chthoniobacteraceae bacterium]